MHSSSLIRRAVNVLGPWTLCGVLSTVGMAGVATLQGCAGNPYGYARQYKPSGDEEPYYERIGEPGTEVTYEEVRRDPTALSGKLLGWFGIVTGAKRLPDGRVQLALDLRFHQPRHLCTDQFESSCRVTISDRVGGPFSTTLRLDSDDESGSERLNVGSLVRVYGPPTGEFDERGGPVIKADFYRHWPHGAYVTTGSGGAMRR
ncbi:MAG: hypothetical protein ABW321_24345 [Polyangiales bacterium]